MGYPKRSCPWWVDGGSGSTWFVYCVSCLSVLSNFTEGKSLPIIKFKCSLTMIRCSFTSIQLHDSITNILLYFLHFFIYLCVCVCVRAHAHAPMCTTCSSQRRTFESRLSPATVWLRNQTRAARLGSRFLYPLSHLTGPLTEFFL